jgi:hypothetical protein
MIVVLLIIIIIFMSANAGTAPATRATKIRVVIRSGRVIKGISFFMVVFRVVKRSSLVLLRRLLKATLRVVLVGSIISTSGRVIVIPS